MRFEKLYIVGISCYYTVSLLRENLFQSKSFNLKNFILKACQIQSDTGSAGSKSILLWGRA
jgi:hypothetical protein